ncbi:MAG TPA: hypothetical protein VFT29_18700 [Gemmatimonadaceae bacterium]|nr:hypothetical protein [Gemmatimonadaceae bacterium]
MQAQVRPDSKWLTIRTQHFYIHFTPELEVVARRAAVDAESAYVQLATHLHPPRGPIDIVLSDDVDFSNGYATPAPTNRIVMYANPPVFESALRFTDDPTQLVVTHELTHIFHLDRVGGIWKPLQQIFGRSPFFFPNAYQPSWLTEGLAVYYESKLTGSGRIEGSEHRMIARTAAAQHVFPRIDQLSLANPNFPYGYSAYAYGSLFMDYLARAHGDSAMRTFVESSSRQLIPFYINRPAKRAFRRSFTAEYRTWAESLTKAAPSWSPPLAGWRDLTVDGAYAAFPRWVNDTSLVYTGTPGRESYGAYRLRLRPGMWSMGSGVNPTPHITDPTPVATRQRIGRRNNRTPNAVLADGSLLYSQLEFTSPYNVRSDLYVDRPNGGTRRLTRGARLAYPDARSDGLIVAVQTLPAGTRIALVSGDGKRITPITNGGPDEQWSDPHWSPDGAHIAAIRWTHGGTSSVVVIDSAGRIARTLISERSVSAAPSWSRDGRYVYFSSDRDGVMNLYRATFNLAAVGTSTGDPRDTTVADSSAVRSAVSSAVSSAAGSEAGSAVGSAVPTEVVRISNAQTGLFEPQPSPSGELLAATIFRADGYHIGIAPLADVRGQALEPIAAIQPRVFASQTTSPTPQSAQPSQSSQAATDSARLAAQGSQLTARPYSAWRSLLPRYWLPFFETGLDSNSSRIGAFTSGEDVVGRHAYQALLYVPTDNSGITGYLYYRNAMFGQPLVELTASQDWENYLRIFDQSQQSLLVGTLRRRIREATLALTLARPRARTSSYVSVGGGFEGRDYATNPASLLDRIDTVFQTSYYYPRVLLSAGWGNAQYPPLAISPEDGISLAGTSRMRWRVNDSSSVTFSVVGAASGYKSLDLPGFAHHVLALRLSGGAQDNRGTGYFEVGGVSGGTLGVVPGYTLGEGRRTFSVRGFPAAYLLGIRAFTGSAEYRAPLRVPGRGLGTLPLFLDRTSVTVFGDVGSAWCPAIFVNRALPSTSLCTQAGFDNGAFLLEPSLIGSVGAELNVSAAVLSWDQPYRFRLGVAAPVTGTELYGGVPALTSYLTVGIAF